MNILQIFLLFDTILTKCILKKNTVKKPQILLQGRSHFAKT